MIRRRTWALAALLLCLGAAGGALLRARLGALAGHGQDRGALEAGAGVSLSSRAAALWARLVSALSPEGGQRFTYERLAKLMAAYRKDPVARAFAMDFARDAELRKIWVEYFESRGQLDGAWLAKRLGKSKGFAQLLNRYANDPGFLKLAEAFTRGLTGEVQGRLAAVLGADKLLEFSSARVGSTLGSRAGSRARTLAGAERFGPGGHAADATREAEGGRGSRGAADPAGERESQALRLTAVREAGPAQTLSAWASICYKEGSGISREQCAAINEHLGEDALWNACLKAGQLDKCVTLCRGSLELGCKSQAEELSDCRSRHSAAACADACGQGDCRSVEPQAAGPDGIARADGIKANETEEAAGSETGDGRSSDPGASRGAPAASPAPSPAPSQDEPTTPEPTSGHVASQTGPNVPNPTTASQSNSQGSERPHDWWEEFKEDVVEAFQDARKAVRSFFKGLFR